MSETKQGPDYDDPIGRCLLTFDNGAKTCRVWRADDGTNGYAARTFFLPAGYTCGMALIDSRPNDTNTCGITLGLAVNGKAIPPSMLNDPSGIFSLPITFPLPPDSGESSMALSRSVQMTGFNSGASAPATLSGASLNLLKVTICYRNTTVEVPDNASLCAGNTILVTAVVQPPGMAGTLTWLQNNAPDNTYDAEISAMENGVTFVPEGAASDDWGVIDRVFLAIGQGSESGYSWNNPDASVHRTTLPTGSESWGGGTLPYNMDNDNSNELPDMDEQGVAYEDDLALGISFGSWGAQWDCEGGFTGPAPVGKVTVQGPARLRGLGEQDNPSGPMLGSSHDMEDGGTVELEGIGLSSAINDVTVLEQTTDAGITTLDNTLNYTVFRVDVLGDINHDEHVDKDDRLFAESQNVTSLFMGCGTKKLTKVLLRTELGLASGQMTLMSGGVRLWSVPNPGPNDVPFLVANTTTNWTCTSPQENLLLYAEGVTPGSSEIVYSCSAGSNGPWFESRLAVTVLKVEFKARDGKINYGFDPKDTVQTGGPYAWASVDKDAGSDVPAIIIDPASAASQVQLTVSSGSSSADINPKTFSMSPVNLALAGQGTAGNALVDALMGSVSCEKLNIMALPKRTPLQVGIYRISDSSSAGTALPAGLPSDAEIITTLNDVFKQAQIEFALDSSSGSYDIPYDTTQLPYLSAIGSFSDGKDGKWEDKEQDTFFTTTPSPWTAQVRVFLLNDNGDTYNFGYSSPYNAYTAGGFGESPPIKHTIVFAQQSHGNLALVVAHEVGHYLRGGSHDSGPYPAGTDRLMRAGTPSGSPSSPVFPVPGRWLRHEDWELSNNKAALILGGVP